MPWDSSPTTAAKSITFAIVSTPFPPNPQTPVLISLTSQSGPISKSPIWTSGVRQLTLLMLTIWKHQEDSTTRFVPLRYFQPEMFIHYAIHQRWGDAPVHSIGAALFANKDQIHFFDEIGYEHAPYQHCPREKKSWEAGRCGCNPGRSFGGSYSITVIITDLPTVHQTMTVIRV
jgi:hypothetical protein